MGGDRRLLIYAIYYKSINSNVYEHYSITYKENNRCYWEVVYVFKLFRCTYTLEIMFIMDMTVKVRMISYIGIV